MLSILVWVIVIGSSIWVLIDAKRIGVQKGQIKGICNMGAVAWFIVCLLLWIVAFPCYLWKRRQYLTANGKTNTRKAPIVIGIVLIALVILSIAGGVLVNSYNAYLDKADASSENQSSSFDQLVSSTSAAQTEAAALCNSKDSDICAHNENDKPVPGETPVTQASASASTQPDVTKSAMSQPEVSQVPAQAVQPSASPAPLVPSLCEQTERTIWSGTSGKKIFSLCASKDLSMTAGYMQYRAGTSGNIDFKYPSTLTEPQGHFTLSESAHSVEVDFSNSGYSYSIVEQADGSETDINVTTPTNPIAKTIALTQASNTLATNSTLNIFQKLGLHQ